MAGLKLVTQVAGFDLPYVLEMKKQKIVCRANRLLLVKFYDNKKVKPSYNWIISPLTQPQVAKQQQQKKYYQDLIWSSGFLYFVLWSYILGLVGFIYSVVRFWFNVLHSKNCKILVHGLVEAKAFLWIASSHKNLCKNIVQQVSILKLSLI